MPAAAATQPGAMPWMKSVAHMISVTRRIHASRFPSRLRRSSPGSTSAVSVVRAGYISRISPTMTADLSTPVTGKFISR